MSDVNNFDIIIEALTILNDDHNIRSHGITKDDLYCRLSCKDKINSDILSKLLDAIRDLSKDKIIVEEFGRLRLAIQGDNYGPNFLETLKKIINSNLLITK